MRNTEYLWGTLNDLNQCCRRLRDHGRQDTEFNHRMLAISISKALTEDERSRADYLFKRGLNGPAEGDDGAPLGDLLFDLFVDVYSRYRAAGGVAHFDGDKRLSRRGYAGVDSRSQPPSASHDRLEDR